MCQPLSWIGSDIIAGANPAGNLAALVDHMLEHEVAEVDLDVALASQSEPVRSTIISVVVKTMQQLWAQEEPSIYWDYRAN